MTDKNEYNEIIATLDRIIEMQDRMIEKISNMDGKMKMITEEINNISSDNKTTTDEDYLSSVMYGVDNNQ
jgi:predicted transcriptional regulator